MLSPPRECAIRKSESNNLSHIGGIESNEIALITRLNMGPNPPGQLQAGFLCSDLESAKYFTFSLAFISGCGIYTASPTKTHAMKNLPSSLSEIRNAAATMFNDSAVVSVEVQASFGIVNVSRDGTVRLA